VVETADLEEALEAAVESTADVELPDDRPVQQS
jgi:hypothetical protein